MYVYSNQVKFLSALRRYLDAFGTLLSKIVPDDQTPIVGYLNWKIIELKWLYSDKSIKRMPDDVFLRLELRHMWLWMAIMLEEMHEEYYENKLFRKEIETFQIKLFFGLEWENNDCPLDSYYPSITTPIRCHSSDEDESSET